MYYSDTHSGFSQLAIAFVVLGFVLGFALSALGPFFRKDRKVDLAGCVSYPLAVLIAGALAQRGRFAGNAWFLLVPLLVATTLYLSALYRREELVSSPLIPVIVCCLTTGGFIVATTGSEKHRVEVLSILLSIAVLGFLLQILFRVGEKIRQRGSEQTGTDEDIL
jgi:hypothetical protein